MAITKIKLKQLENAATVGSIVSTDTSNIATYVAPPASSVLWGYDHGQTATVPVTIGTNLSYDAGTNTLNASAGAGGYTEIQEEGSVVGASNTKINFVGSGLTAADQGSGVTSVTVATFLNTLATAGAVNLASHVTGTLPVANGGSGATTLTGLLQGNGTSAITAITNSSTVGQVLRVTAASTYAWGALDLADTDAVTGILAIANGGTGSSTQNFVDLTTGQSVGGAKTFTSNITISATPSAATDAATVGWVMDNVAGFKSGSVRGATTAILTATAQDAQTITIGGTTFVHDGVTYANDETILVKDSVTGGAGGTFNNGVYEVSGVGTAILLTRVAWMNTAAEVDGVYVMVQDGTTNAGTLWFTISEVTTLGTDAIAFTQIQTSGTIAGTAATNKVAFGSATNTLTSDTNFHFESGQLLIGTATLETSNKLATKGGGTGATTFGYRHLDSSSTKVFSVADNGTIVIGTSALTISSSSMTASGTYAINGGASAANTLNLTSGASTTTGVGVTVINSGGTKSFTSGNYDALNIPGAFTTTTGSGTYRALSITGTIDQSAGGTGITRGLHINHTLTTPADYRGLEVTANSSHYSIYSTAGKVRLDLGSDATGDTWYRAAGGEMARLAAGATSGHVLTSNGSGAAPSWQVATGGTKTVGYVTGSGTDTYDLDAGVVVLDIDGAAFAFTVPSNLDLVDVYRNGIMLSRSGTVSRDYTLNSGTGVLVLASSLASDETLKLVKRV